MALCICVQHLQGSSSSGLPSGTSEALSTPCPARERI
jgi:hypothetical protein